MGVVAAAAPESCLNTSVWRWLYAGWIAQLGGTCQGADTPGRIGTACPPRPARVHCVACSQPPLVPSERRELLGARALWTFSSVLLVYGLLAPVCSKRFPSAPPPGATPWQASRPLPPRALAASPHEATRPFEATRDQSAPPSRHPEREHSLKVCVCVCVRSVAGCGRAICCRGQQVAVRTRRAWARDWACAASDRREGAEGGRRAAAARGGDRRWHLGSAGSAPPGPHPAEERPGDQAILGIPSPSLRRSCA